MSPTVRDPDDDVRLSDSGRSKKRSTGRSSDNRPSTDAPKTEKHSYREPQALRTEPPWKLPGQPGAFVDDLYPDDFARRPDRISSDTYDGADTPDPVMPSRASGSKRWLIGVALMAAGVGGCVWSLDGYVRALQVAGSEWWSAIAAAKSAISPNTRHETALARTAVPRLTVTAARTWRIDQPAPLTITYADVGANASVVINGLAPGSTLWAGTPVPPNGWRLASADVKRAVLTPPSGFAGVMNLDLELRLADSTLVDSKSLQLKWSDPNSPAPAVPTVSAPAAPAPTVSKPAASAPTASAPTVTAPPAPAASVPSASSERPLAGTEVALLMKRGAELIANGNIGAARLMFQSAAEAGESAAAFALAETYDPFVLEELGAKGITPDAALAQRWYEKAKTLGSNAARDRLARLKR